ncbi:MAG: sulfatase-like hydrolase/transferase [Thermoanaerobaculia bacterium]|nr:sulfatase-like hydrolase/transferase [Thermoanaerobaculia bacterium]
MTDLPRTLLPLLPLALLLCCGPGETDPSSSGFAEEPVEEADRSVPENLLLITVDTLRADAVGFSGNESVSTPALDALAAQGRVYPNAHAHNVVTLPSHANILTGLHPYQHGVRNNGGFELGSGPPTLAGLLKAEGFTTAAVVGSFPLDSRFGLDRGFELYDDEFGEPGEIFHYAERPGNVVVSRGHRWWDDHRGERRFLWLHLFDPHAPYEPPEPYRSRAPTPYLGEVEAVDSYLAPLLEPFLSGAEAPTVVVFTSDHGEALGEHGEETHGFFAYEATLRVPLVLWGPGIESGLDIREAQHVDLLPTLLEMLDVPAPPGLPGRSLLLPPDPERATYFESLSPHFDLGAAPLRGVIRRGRKMIELPRPELYDLTEDPDETENLVGDQPRRYRRLRDLLPGESAWPPAAETPDAETADRLRGLGYVASSAPARESYGPADDPKNLLGLRLALNRIANLESRGRTEAALALGRETLEEYPRVPALYEYLVKIHLERGRAQPALELLRKAEREGATNATLGQQLARTLVRLQRPREALAVIEGIDSGPRDPRLVQEAALALVQLGRPDDARESLETRLETHPDDGGAWETLSYVALQAGNLARAREAARRAVEVDPSRADAWNNLGVASYQLERPGEALEAWRRAAELDPDNPDILFNLGLAASEAGDPETARRSLRRFLELVPDEGFGPQRRAARTLLSRLGP